MNAVDSYAPLKRVRCKVGGFTLIELMIAVAVVGILAAIAYPSYVDSVRKSRRGQAKADLLELTQLAERHRTVNNSYEGFGNPSGTNVLAGELGKSPREGRTYYEITYTNVTDSTYTLTAVPVSGAGQEKDARCLSLGINQAGVKTIGSGATGTVGECW